MKWTILFMIKTRLHKIICAKNGFENAQNVSETPYFQGLQWSNSKGRGV